MTKCLCRLYKNLSSQRGSLANPTKAESSTTDYVPLWYTDLIKYIFF